MGLWSSICFSSIGDINRERYMGILPFLFASPSSFNVLILAKVTGNTILAMLSLVISTITANLLFGLTLTVPHIDLFIVAMIIMIVSFISISIPISYLMLLSRKTTLYMNLLDIPITLLCGFVFPFSVLPIWVQPISQCLIPTWTTILLRESLQVDIHTATFREALLRIAILIGVYLLGTYLLWRQIEKKVRRDGTLEVNE